MKALILNSGMGSRMGMLTTNMPKCMSKLNEDETILERQLKILADKGIAEVIITTGKYDEIIRSYCQQLNLGINIQFVFNPLYQETNYIYSIYCAREYIRDDLVIMHGDLVFEPAVLQILLDCGQSCMAVSESSSIPEKDFKAVIAEKKIVKIGVEYFENVVAAQPLYVLKQQEWNLWLNSIINFCENKKWNCYAENAFNEVSEKIDLKPCNINDLICQEVDTPEDLDIVRKKLEDLPVRNIYMAFSTDFIHGAHTQLIQRASKLGNVIVGVLSDEAVASFKSFPLLPYDERKNLFENLKNVNLVVKQNMLSYVENLKLYKPDIVVHGDDWREGVQKSIREEVLKTLKLWNGLLIEYPYVTDDKYRELEKKFRREAALPDIRRGRLKKAIQLQGLVTAIEAHSGITGLIAEKTVAYQNGYGKQFDAMWVSSLCDSTAKGKPDIELVDMTSRLRTIDDIMEVTTKPVIFDGDTGGYTEHFVYTVRTVERMGVSMIVIEDKIGLKKNSLFGVEVQQTQDTIEGFCNKIRTGKKAQKSPDFMICARIESLILEQGMDDALQRAFAYVEAGADAIMIHSRRKEPDEIFEFVEKFREQNRITPIVVVPTSFNSVTEEQFKQKGVNVVIYANQLTRSGFPAMQRTAMSILENHRCLEADEFCMSIKEIINLIPEE